MAGIAFADHEAWRRLVTIGNNPSGGTLSGMATVDAVAADTVFDELSIDKPGNGYTLVYRLADGTTLVSDPFNGTTKSGQRVTFGAAASGGPTVQWEVSIDHGRHFTPIKGAKPASLTVTAGRKNHQTLYRARFTNAAGQAVTKVVVLVVQ